jgi:hypothetical protein
MKPRTVYEKAVQDFTETTRSAGTAGRVRMVKLKNGARTALTIAFRVLEDQNARSARCAGICYENP